MDVSVLENKVKREGGYYFFLHRTLRQVRLVDNVSVVAPMRKHLRLRPGKYRPGLRHVG